MHLYTWIILIALLFGLGMILKRIWLRQTPKEESTEAASDTAPVEESGLAQLTNSVRVRIQALRSGLAGTEQDNVVPQFREWAQHAFAGQPEIQQWLAALTDAQITALTDHFREFCRDMGFELNWLFEKQVSPNAGLMKGLTEIVLFYSRASYQAVRLQEEVETFRSYREFMQNPKSHTNRELGEHLFGKLVEQGKGTVKISEHLAASPHKRQQQMIDTIQQVAVEDPQLFNATLKLVLVERAVTRRNGETISTNGTVGASTANVASA